MGWPQITLIALTAASGGLVLANHGEPREYNFWHFLVGGAVEFYLLYAGGFFK